MRHYCDLKGGIGGLHSFCGACVCLITPRLPPLYLFFYEEKRLSYVYFLVKPKIRTGKL